MPRRRTLTGKGERQENRNMQRLRNRIVNAPGSNLIRDDDYSNGILRDEFKSAIEANIPSNFNSFHIGDLNIICVRCQAKHFKSEVTSGDRTEFTSCCQKGKVLLPHLTENAFFKALYEGLSSSNQNIKSRSKNYFDNIRKYNA